MDRVTEYLNHDGQGQYYLFSEIETELHREVLVCRSDRVEESDHPLEPREPPTCWQEVARIDPELETVVGPCTYLSAMGPKGVAFDVVGVVAHYLRWKGTGASPDDPSFVKVCRNPRHDGDYSLETAIEVMSNEDNDGES